MHKAALALFLLVIPGLAGCGKSAAPPQPIPADNQASQPEHVEAPATIANSIGMKLVRIPAGEFDMGSAEAGADARSDEKPRHRVRITHSFYMGVYEVTQAEYQHVMGGNRSFFSPTGPGKNRLASMNADRFPMEQVSWHEAVEFCRRLSQSSAEKQAGRSYRLPTEAEWEYACRAGTTTRFHFGDSLSATQANFDGNYPHGNGANGPFLLRTTEVGSYPPNAFGLYDMHGNVWEWCADWHDPDYYKKSPVDDPPGPKSGATRVIRGGDWRSEGGDCRSAFRYADMPSGRYYVVGFRVIMTLGGVSREKPIADQVAKESGSPQAPSKSAPPATIAQGEDWPRWRGPRGDGTWHGPSLPEKWPVSGLRCSWRQPVGGGYAGPVIADGRVYLTDHWTEPEEVERILCFDAATGKPLWDFQYRAQYGKLEYGNGPRSTPTVFDKRLYTLGALGHLHCLDALTGKRLWSKDLVRDFHAQLPLWAFAASPVIFGDLLIIHAGAEPDGCLIAFDRRTGQVVWRKLPDGAGYSTPIIVDHHGLPLLICWTPNHVRGLDPQTGSLDWSVPFEVSYGTAIATPIFHEQIVLVSSYWDGAKAIRLGRKPADAKVIWDNRRQLRALMTTPLYRAGYAYLLDIRHGLTCFELKTGKKLWDDDNRMTPKGRNPQATLVWLGEEDRAIILNSEGDLILARLSPQGYQEQSRTHVVGPTWAHPAYAGGCVFARNDHELVCVSLLEGNPMSQP